MKMKFNPYKHDAQEFYEDEFRVWLYDNYPVGNGDMLIKLETDGFTFDMWFKDHYPAEWEAENQMWEERIAIVKQRKKDREDTYGNS